MTLTPGMRKLYCISHMCWLTDKERKEVEEFQKQFAGELIVNEQDSPYHTKYLEQSRNTNECPADDGYPEED